MGRPAARGGNTARPRACTPPKGSGERKVKCGNSGEEHATRECPKPMLEISKRKCFECGKEGHEARNCPEKKKKSGEGRGGRGGDGRGRGAHVVEQGDGTQWVMMVRPKDSEGYERVGQKPITVADFRVRYAGGSQRQRREDEKQQKNRFACLDELGEPDVEDSPPPPPALHKEPRLRPERKSPSNILTSADSCRCSCHDSEDRGSCNALHKSDLLDLSKEASSTEERTATNGVVVARDSWPTISVPIPSVQVSSVALSDIPGSSTLKLTEENPPNPGSTPCKNPGEHVITPDAPLRGTFEASKPNKCVSFCSESTSDSRREKWERSQEGGAADRYRRRSRPLPFELYRHDCDVEAEAVRKYCKFHELRLNDLPIDMLLVEIQMSSLGTTGWAFADVDDWDCFETCSSAHAAVRGGCVTFDEPNTQTCATPALSTASDDLQQECRERVEDQLRAHMDDELVEVLKALGTFDEVVRKTIAVIESRDPRGSEVLPVADWIDKVIKVTLDSGACDHILDVVDAPGYANFLVESPGSKRDQQYIVGNGAEVPNEGQVTLNLEANGMGNLPGNLIKSVFQVAEITRPLMSVSRVCELGHKCIFDQEKAEVVAKGGKVLCTFRREGGLYVAEMKLKAPEGFQRPAR